MTFEIIAKISHPNGMLYSVGINGYIINKFPWSYLLTGGPHRPL